MRLVVRWTLTACLLAALPLPAPAAGVGSLTLTPLPGQPNTYVVRSAVTGSSCPLRNASHGACDYNDAHIWLDVTPCPVGENCNTFGTYSASYAPPASNPDPSSAAFLDTLELHPDSTYVIRGEWGVDVYYGDDLGCWVVCDAGGPTGNLRVPTRAIATVPVSAGQSITATGAGYDIALRNPTLPQGLNVELVFDAAVACPNQTVTIAKLVPRIGTGRVTTLRRTGEQGGQLRYAGYFEIDNFTAPGYYDLLIGCSDGGSRVLAANIRYLGYVGYQASGAIRNLLTGNSVRGARVSLWQEQTTGGFQLVSGQVAGDGTYSFSAGPGTYKILIQYELAGEQWRGPFVVSAPAVGEALAGGLDFEGLYSAIPFEETFVSPVTPDTIAPTFAIAPVSPRSANGTWADAGVGLSVVEAVPGTVSNVAVSVSPYALGATSVGVAMTLIDSSASGSATFQAIDQLGNRATQVLQLAPTTGVEPGSPIRETFALRLIRSDRARGVSQIGLTLGRPGVVAVDVFDLRGARVRSLARRDFEAGSHVIGWDGRDDAGSRVATGMYFARAELGDQRATLRMLQIR